MCIIQATTHICSSCYIQRPATVDSPNPTYHIIPCAALHSEHGTTCAELSVPIDSIYAIDGLRCEATACQEKFVNARGEEAPIFNIVIKDKASSTANGLIETPREKDLTDAIERYRYVGLVHGGKGLEQMAMGMMIACKRNKTLRREMMRELRRISEEENSEKRVAGREIKEAILAARNLIRERNGDLEKEEEDP